MKSVSGLLAALFLTGVLSSADIEVKAGINADRIGLDDILVYTLTFKGIQNPKQPDLSYLADFKVVQTSQSSEFQFVNGISAFYTSFVYYLAPVRIGRLSIPPAASTIADREYRTRAFQIEVVKGSLSLQNPPQPKPLSPFGDDFAESPFPRKEARIEVQLKTNISKTKALKGEQLIYRVLLYTVNTVDSVNLLSNQSLEGFWQEWFPIPQTITGRSEMINGTLYQIFEIRKAALYPAKAGTLTIPPLNFQFGLADPQSAFFGSKPIIRSTPEIKIEVTNPSPEAADLPVGSFSLDAGVDRNATDINGMITLHLKLAGTGNIKTLEPPVLQSNEFFKVFPAKISRETVFGKESLSGTVNCEIPVSFNRSGLISIPPFEFRFLHPVTRRIITLRSPLLSVRVTGEKEKTEEAVSMPQSQIVQKGQDIDFIIRGKIDDQEDHLYRKSWMKTLLVLPFLLNLLLVLRLSLWDRWLAASPAIRRRQLLARTRRQLNGIGQYDEIASVLENYLRDKTGLGLSEINDQRIRDRFLASGIPPDETEKFLRIRNQAEFAKYSPTRKSPREWKEDLCELLETIKTIDGKLR